MRCNSIKNQMSSLEDDLYTDKNGVKGGLKIVSAMQLDCIAVVVGADLVLTLHDPAAPL